MTEIIQRDPPCITQTITVRVLQSLCVCIISPKFASGKQLKTPLIQLCDEAFCNQERYFVALRFLRKNCRQEDVTPQMSTNTPYPHSKSCRHILQAETFTRRDINKAQHFSIGKMGVKSQKPYILRGDRHNHFRRPEIIPSRRVTAIKPHVYKGLMYILYRRTQKMV